MLLTQLLIVFSSIYLNPAKEFKGTVVGEENKTFEIIVESDGKEFHGKTDENGQFKIEIEKRRLAWRRSQIGEISVEIICNPTNSHEIQRRKHWRIAKLDCQNWHIFHFGRFSSKPGTVLPLFMRVKLSPDFPAPRENYAFVLRLGYINSEFKTTIVAQVKTTEMEEDGLKLELNKLGMKRMRQTEPTLRMEMVEMTNLNVCSFCLDEFSEKGKNALKMAGCEHFAHRNCFKKWLNRERTRTSDQLPEKCPQCRNPIKTKQNKPFEAEFSADSRPMERSLFSAELRMPVLQNGNEREEAKFAYELDKTFLDDKNAEKVAKMLNRQTLKVNENSGGRIGEENSGQSSRHTPRDMAHFDDHLGSGGIAVEEQMNNYCSSDYSLAHLWEYFKDLNSNNLSQQMPRERRRKRSPKKQMRKAEIDKNSQQKLNESDSEVMSSTEEEIEQLLEMLYLTVREEKEREEKAKNGKKEATPNGDQRKSDQEMGIKEKGIADQRKENNEQQIEMEKQKANDEDEKQTKKRGPTDQTDQDGHNVTKPTDHNGTQNSERGISDFDKEKRIGKEGKADNHRKTEGPIEGKWSDQLGKKGPTENQKKFGIEKGTMKTLKEKKMKRKSDQKESEKRVTKDERGKAFADEEKMQKTETKRRKEWPKSVGLFRGKSPNKVWELHSSEEFSSSDFSDTEEAEDRRKRDEEFREELIKLNKLYKEKMTKKEKGNSKEEKEEEKGKKEKTPKRKQWQIPTERREIISEKEDKGTEKTPKMEKREKKEEKEEEEKEEEEKEKKEEEKEKKEEEEKEKEEYEKENDERHREELIKMSKRMAKNGNSKEEKEAEKGKEMTPKKRKQWQIPKSE
ncbi:hypothetical protein niasHT_006796 [Heterodera trifolii]|uniref:RING-type domain-containing protein n=1 Tax=Heterodera trifolii TaxID=157864 RepID=A0ABD2M7J3_9BILA